jgi:hypothetical protein
MNPTMDAEPINFLWLLAVAGGPLLLAVLFGWALLRRRRLSARERADQVRGTEKVFDEHH